MAGIPFKLCVDEKMQIGIVAKSFKHLKAVAQEKFGLSENISVFLDDGTLVCDEDYFHMLEPQTKLTVRDNWQALFLGHKRPSASLGNEYPAKQTKSVHPQSRALMTAMSQVQQFPQSASTPGLHYLEGYQQALAIYQQPKVYRFVPNFNFVPHPEWQYQNSSRMHNAVHNPAAHTVPHPGFANPSMNCQRSPPLLLKVPSAITNPSSHLHSTAPYSSPPRSQSTLQTILTSPPSVQPLSPRTHSQPPNFRSPIQSPSSMIDSCTKTVIPPQGQVGTAYNTVGPQTHPPTNAQNSPNRIPPLRSPIQSPSSTIENLSSCTKTVISPQGQVGTAYSPNRIPPLRSPIQSPSSTFENLSSCTKTVISPQGQVGTAYRPLTHPPTNAHNRIPPLRSPIQSPSSMIDSCTKTVIPPQGQVGTAYNPLRPQTNPPTNAQNNSNRIPPLHRIRSTSLTKLSATAPCPLQSLSIPCASVDHEREAIIEKTIQYLKAPSSLPHVPLVQPREASIQKPMGNHKNKEPSGLPALPLIQPRLQDPSADDGYASCSTTTSPSPSITEAPISVATLMEQLPLEKDMTMTVGASPTNVKADGCTDQTIPHVHEDVSSMESVSDVTSDAKSTQVKVKEDVDQQFIVGIPITVENGHIITKSRIAPVEVILIDDSDVEVIEEKNVIITPPETKSPILEEAGEIGNRNNKTLSPNVCPTNKEKPVDVVEYGSEKVVLTSKQRCTVEDVNEALTSVMKLSLDELQRDLKPIQTSFEIQRLFTRACECTCATNQTVIVEESVLLDSSNFKEDDESEHIVLNPEDLKGVLGLENHEEESSVVLQSSDVANEVTISEEPTAQDDSQALVSLLTEHEGQVETEVLGIECDFDVTSVTLPWDELHTPVSKYGYSPSDIPEHINESPIAETIDSLLEIADLLSAEDSATVKAFLSGTPTDPRHKVKTFPVTRMPDGRSLFLQINFSSGEWEGRLTA